MLVTVLFWGGVVTSALVGFQSLYRAGDDKRGAVAFPFMWFAAAAVAKYLGM